MRKPSNTSEKSSDPNLDFKLTRHARYSVSGTSVGIISSDSPNDDDPSKSAMPNEDVLARLDALFLDVKQRREEELRKKYSYLDSPKYNNFRGGDRRGSSTLERSTIASDRRNSANTSGSSVDNRRNSNNTSGQKRSSLAGNDRRGSNQSNRRWSSTGDRLVSLNGLPSADYRGTYDSLDRRKSSSSSSTSPLKGGVTGGNVVLRRPNNSSGATSNKDPSKRHSSYSPRNPEKRFSWNSSIDKNLDKRSSFTDTVDGGKSVRKPSLSKEKSPTENGSLSHVVLRRNHKKENGESGNAPTKPGYRRDSLDVEKLLGTRRQSYYDSRILEENESGGIPRKRASFHSQSVRFSPPPNSSHAGRDSPVRSSPPRSSPSRSSPSRTTPSRSTPPRPLSFGRIRRASDLDPGPLDRLFDHKEDEIHHRKHSDHSFSGFRNASKDSEGKPRFLAVTRLEDVQAIRCAEFHPSGQFYAVGSNSKTLRICAYPKLNDLREDHVTYQPTVLFKRTKHHKGSIYCLGWSPDGDLIATGSNDKTIKLMRFNADSCTIEGQDVELSMHDGTVRDICFIEDSSNKTSLLISGGAGDCKIYVTDCGTGMPFQALSGHTGHILALHTWGGAMFVSGSQDRTVRFWDLRTRGCVNVITPGATPTKPGAPVASACVDPSGRLLVTGHEDSVCSLYDIRGNRTIQAFRPHSSDVRSIRFSPSAYYLLTAGYDNKLVLTDLQGDLTLPLPSVIVADHSDKAISGRWHPSDFSFISTSADKSCVLWALPPV